MGRRRKQQLKIHPFDGEVFKLGLKNGSFCYRITDSSLRTCNILTGDVLIVHEPMYYEDGTLVIASADSPNAFQPARYYVGRYIQVGELVTVKLPSGLTLLPHYIHGAVTHVVRSFT